MKLTDEQYDNLALFGRLLLPIIATLISTVCADLGLECGELISKLIMAFVVAINSFLEGVSKNYYKNKETEEVIEYDNHIAE